MLFCALHQAAWKSPWAGAGYFCRGCGSTSGNWERRGEQNVLTPAGFWKCLSHTPSLWVRILFRVSHSVAFGNPEILFLFLIFFTSTRALSCLFPFATSPRRRPLPPPPVPPEPRPGPPPPRPAGPSPARPRRRPPPAAPTVLGPPAAALPGSAAGAAAGWAPRPGAASREGGCDPPWPAMGDGRSRPSGKGGVRTGAGRGRARPPARRGHLFPFVYLSFSPLFTFPSSFFFFPLPITFFLFSSFSNLHFSFAFPLPTFPFFFL